MISSPLNEQIILIQKEYGVLLSKSLPIIESDNYKMALDEIEIFWRRNIETVQLYLKYYNSSEDSYVFTAVTHMDYDSKEHFPFLLMGNKLYLDDPLGKYSEICRKLELKKEADFYHKQIVVTAKDNLKIIENTNNRILVLPLRLISQSTDFSFLYKCGENAFLSLFNGLETIDDYFDKCKTIDDIMAYVNSDIEKLILFSEDDDFSISLKERFYKTVKETEYFVDDSKSDSYNFFMLVFGFIQQAIDIIQSCYLYKCIPYIRYPVAFHYVTSLLDNIDDIKYTSVTKFKMSISFVIHKLFDFDRIKITTNEYISLADEYRFNENLFLKLIDNGINKDNYINHNVASIILSELDKYYDYLENQQS